MTPVAKGVTALGGGAAVAAGGYGTKVLLDGRKPYTLEHVSKYQKDGADSSKFGGKFASHFLSNEEEHKTHNRSHWEVNVNRFLGEKGATLKTDGFLKDVTSKKTAYDTALNSKNGVSEKFKDLVDEFIKSCVAKYDATPFNTEGDKEKWQEYWKYCSIDGKDRWGEQSTGSAS